MKQTKSYEIPKRLIYEAYKRVKANKGGAGVDSQSQKDFDKDLENNLYKLWNRMSSGSYFPQAVKRVNIPKSGGGTRPLGIPTITDRIAQMAVKMLIEPELESHFHPDSYGYRPDKSVHQAVAQVKKRCWQRGWVLDMDIKGFFDAINHELLMRAVEKHVKEPWQLLYIQRWLESPVWYQDGELEARTQGTPQGGVISPLLANLFLHYAFDSWIEVRWSGIQFERYADDIICHCRSEEEAENLKSFLTQRFTECGLQLHPEKTKIVYCKSWKYRENRELISFDFLGFTFKPRKARMKDGRFLLSFQPAVSNKSAKRIRAEINSWPWLYWVRDDMLNIIKHSQSKIRGWMAYYGQFNQWEIIEVLYHFDKRLSRWAKRKYKRLKTIKQAKKRVKQARGQNPLVFAHWNQVWK